MIIIAILIVIALILVAGLLIAGFVSASPGEIKVISGPRGQRVLHGKTGWKIPILER
ncbi:MAG: flotillin family protein, partial [Catonella sp.]